MTQNTDALCHLRATLDAPGAALHRALALAEAAGDTARVATLRALWPALERRGAVEATAWPQDHERRHRLPPPLTIDDAMLEAWLRDGPLPPQ